MPKTGTTYIQSLLRANAQQLSNAGIYYPTEYEEIGFAHHSIYLALCKGGGPSLRHYRAVVSSHRSHVILSSETFCRLDDSEMVQLLELVAPRCAYAVVYFREPAGYFRSLWTTGIQQGLTDQFEEEFARAAIAGANDYVGIADRACRVFGRERTVFVAYDRLMESGADLCQHFLQAIVGMPALSLGFDWSSAHRNVRPSFAVQEVNRCLNAALHARGIQPEGLVYQFLEHTKPDLGWLPLRSFRSQVSLSTELPSLAAMLDQLAQRHAPNFINAAGPDRIFDQTYERTIEQVNIRQMLADVPELVEHLDALADRCLAWCARWGVQPKRLAS